MLGVGALGLYAVYRLVTAPREQGPQSDTALPRPPVPSRPLPTPMPSGPLPIAAGPLGAPPAGFPIIATAASPTVHLANSRAYRGRFDFDRAVTPDQVRGLLQQLGFDVESMQIFSSPEEAAPHIAAFALANPGQNTRWFHARFLEPGTRDVPRPRELVAIWTVIGAPQRTLVSGFAGYGRPVYARYPYAYGR